MTPVLARRIDLSRTPPAGLRLSLRVAASRPLSHDEKVNRAFANARKWLSRAAALTGDHRIGDAEAKVIEIGLDNGVDFPELEPAANRE